MQSNPVQSISAQCIYSHSVQPPILFNLEEHSASTKYYEYGVNSPTTCPPYLFSIQYWYCRQYSGVQSRQKNLQYYHTRSIVSQRHHPSLWTEYLMLIYSTPCRVLSSHTNTWASPQRPPVQLLLPSSSFTISSSKYSVHNTCTHSGELLSNGPSPAQPGVTTGPGQSPYPCGSGRVLS